GEDGGVLQAGRNARARRGVEKGRPSPTSIRTADMRAVLRGVVSRSEPPDPSQEDSHAYAPFDDALGFSLDLTGVRPGGDEAQHHPDPVRRFRVRRLGSLWWRSGAGHADTQPGPAGRRGHDVLLLLRTAELHPGSCRRADRSLSES